jgi:hypothetical protein
MAEGSILKRNGLRNQVAKSLLVAALASTLWLGWARIPRTVTGGTLPLDVPPLRLCSEDRVLQTTVDKQGQFTFHNVPPGAYHLTERLNFTGTEVKTGIALTNVVAIKWRGPFDRNNSTGEELDCAVDPRMLCSSYGLYTHIVEYGERRAQQSALILGSIENGFGERQKLAGVQVLLTNARDPADRYWAVSDKDGRFRFAPPAGRYVLHTSLQGFVDVAVRFLIPRENNTMVTIQTSVWFNTPMQCID